MLRNLFALVFSLLVVFGVEQLLRFWWLRWVCLTLTLIIRETDTEILDTQDQRVSKALNRVEFVMLDRRPESFASIWGIVGEDSSAACAISPVTHYT